MVLKLDKDRQLRLDEKFACLKGAPRQGEYVFLNACIHANECTNSGIEDQNAGICRQPAHPPFLFLLTLIVCDALLRRIACLL